MKTRRTFSSEQKVKIVLSVIQKELTVVEASQKHQITPSLIHKWRDAFLKKAHLAFEESTEESGKDKKIKQYEYVITKLTTQNDFLEKVLLVTK